MYSMCGKCKKKCAESSTDLCGNIIQDVEMSFLTLYTKLHTCTSFVNLCLSSGGLPRDPGYSKSRSRPSKLCMRRKSMANRMNLLRFSDVNNMADIGQLLASRNWTQLWQFGDKRANLVAIRLTATLTGGSHPQSTEPSLLYRLQSSLTGAPKTWGYINAISGW